MKIVKRCFFGGILSMGAILFPAGLLRAETTGQDSGWQMSQSLLWYEQPWVWVAASCLFLLLLVLVLQRDNKK